MNEWIKKLQKQFSEDMTVATLRWAITLWAIFVIALAWLIDNGWVLAGLLAYEVLP